jgi:hypothetical protein
MGNRMKLYQKTVDVLLDAYNNNTLEHGNCSACAVGNICKEAADETRIKNSAWKCLFRTVIDEAGNSLSQPAIQLTTNDVIHASILIDATGYTVAELAQIEKAFETSLIEAGLDYFTYTTGTPAQLKYGQYIGLVAVLKVLEKIHATEEIVHEKAMTDLTAMKDKALANI